VEPKRRTPTFLALPVAPPEMSIAPLLVKVLLEKKTPLLDPPVPRSEVDPATLIFPVPVLIAAY